MHSLASVTLSSTRGSLSQSRRICFISTSFNFFFGLDRLGFFFFSSLSVFPLGTRSEQLHLCITLASSHAARGDLGHGSFHSGDNERGRHISILHRAPSFYFQHFSINRPPFTWPAFALDYRHPPSSIWRALASVNISSNLMGYGRLLLSLAFSASDLVLSITWAIGTHMCRISRLERCFRYREEVRNGSKGERAPRRV
jgi:hypothetical protein